MQLEKGDCYISDITLLAIGYNETWFPVSRQRFLKTLLMWEDYYNSVNIWCIQISDEFCDGLTQSVASECLN